MSDSENGTVTSDRLPDSDSLAIKAATSAVTPAFGGELHVGQVWRDLVIEEPWAGDGPDGFIAEHRGLMRKVVIRAFPVRVGTEWRRGAWDRLAAMPSLQTVRCISAEEEGGWRYEISAVPPPTTLKEWLACNRPGFAEIESLIRQLSATLGALHAQGVVHLNIRPDAIHIDDSGAEPVYILGGLHEATLYTQAELEPSDVDPFYAPPESTRLLRELAGTKLCAWDWWSTGRVLQEFLLGRHVIGVIYDGDLAALTPESRARADALLRERQPAGTRAGALEFMQLEPALVPLMRGLLTGSCEARWGFDAIQRWLRHEPVQDHYDLPCNARLWVLKGRGFTLAEAADYFTRAPNWDEGEEMLFNTDRPESLGAFLKESPAHREDLQRLQAVCDLSEGASWGAVPVVTRRTVAAALAWLTLANGSGVRTSLRVKGQSGDVVGLGELLRASGPSAGVALFTALLTPAVVGFVEPFDAPAARVLTAIGTKGADAIAHGAEFGWLEPDDEKGRARIFELALKASALLREPIELLRSLYATNSNPGLAALLALKTPAPRDMVILAFTAEAPERFGYITHETSRRQLYAALTKEGDQIVASLFWLKLNALLRMTRLWGAPAPFFAGVILVVTILTAWLGRSAVLASLVASVLLLSRVFLWWRLRSMARSFDPTATAWKWEDGRKRSALQAEEALQRQKMGESGLNAELQRIQTGLLSLAKATKQAPGLVQPCWWDLHVALQGTALFTAALLVFLVSQQRPTFFQAKRTLVAANTETALALGSNAEPSTTEAVITPKVPAVDPAVLVASGRYEVIDDGFGRQLRGPLQPWTFYPTDSVLPLDIVATAPASAEQSAFALVSGAVLLQPFPRRAVNVLLAVRVPTTRGFGFLIYNTKERRLLDDEVRLIREPMKEHNWYQLGRKRIGYLGTPAALGPEISLAPP